MSNEKTLDYYSITHDEHNVTLRLRRKVLYRYLMYSIIGTLAIIGIIWLFYSIIAWGLTGGQINKKVLNLLLEVLIIVLKYVPFIWPPLLLLFTLSYLRKCMIRIRFDEKVIYIRHFLKPRRKIERFPTLDLSIGSGSQSKNAVVFHNSNKRYRVMDAPNTHEAQAIIDYLKKVPGLLS